jgi:hypothetical protein
MFDNPVLNGRIIALQKIFLCPGELRVQGSVDLKPGWHLTRRAAPVPSGSVRLSDVAQVIRCQLPRAKVDSQETNALTAEAVITGSPLGGVMIDGSFVCREIVLGDLDELTGFVREYGELTRVEEFSPTGRQGKYLLRSDDILLAFRSAESSPGKQDSWRKISRRPPSRDRAYAPSGLSGWTRFGSTTPCSGPTSAAASPLRQRQQNPDRQPGRSARSAAHVAGSAGREAHQRSPSKDRAKYGRDTELAAENPF